MINAKNTITTRLTHFFDVMRPIILSAFSIFVSFCVLQPIALFFGPSFSLLANRGVGKIAFTTIVLLHIVLLTATMSQKYFRDFLAINFYFVITKNWIKSFSMFFGLFFFLHIMLILLLALTPFVHIHPETIMLIPTKLPNLALGFIATFFLAWTEESIFRGTLYPFLAQRLSILTSVSLTSLIFMLTHDLTNPLTLITSKWQLGLGLFLLGFFLNLLFAISNKLYIGMGAHAGLVFVKVILRRIPAVSYNIDLPWWLSQDLRESLLTDVLFLLLILIILTLFRQKLLKNS